MSQASTRNKLLRWVKVFSLFALLISGYVVVDFSFNQAQKKIYRFAIPPLTDNQPVLLRQESLAIVVARFDAAMRQRLTAMGRLSAISQSFRDEAQRFNKDGYFVALAYGTKLSCPLEILADSLRESCSDARYDLLGRSQHKADYPDLEIPQYTFNPEYTLLTIE